MKVSKGFFSLAVAGLALAILTISLPGAARAVAAALVQVNNTTANPAITQSVSEQAAQIVQLSCVTTTCSLAGSLAIKEPYVVPAGESLVVTAVDLFSENANTPTEPCQLDHPVGVSGTGNRPFGSDQALTWEILAGSATLHFIYPSGIVFHANDTVAFVNNPFAPITEPAPGCTDTGTLFGYLTAQ